MRKISCQIESAHHESSSILEDASDQFQNQWEQEFSSEKQKLDDVAKEVPKTFERIIFVLLVCGDALNLVK